MQHHTTSEEPQHDHSIRKENPPHFDERKKEMGLLQFSFLFDCALVTYKVEMNIELSFFLSLDLRLPSDHPSMEYIRRPASKDWAGPKFIGIASCQVCRRRMPSIKALEGRVLDGNIQTPPKLMPPKECGLESAPPPNNNNNNSQIQTIFV